MALSDLQFTATTTSPFLCGTKSPLDAKRAVGESCILNDISDLASSDFSSYIGNGQLVEDYDNGITWQLHTSDGSTYSNRVYDGRFFVKAVSVTNIGTLSGAKTIDSISCVAGDTVLVAGETNGANNGVYVVAAGAWSRHTVFDTDVDNITGIIFQAEQGTIYANSQWELTNIGAITIGSTSLYFEISSSWRSHIIEEISTDSQQINSLAKYTYMSAATTDLEVALPVRPTIGLPYIFQKVDATNNAVVVVDAVLGLGSMQTTLSREGEWAECVYQPALASWAVRHVDGIDFESALAPSDVTLTKYNTYVANDHVTSDITVTYPVDVFPNYSYTGESQKVGDLICVDYDGNTLATIVSGKRASFVITTNPNIVELSTITGDGQLTIKIPQDWKVGNFYFTETAGASADIAIGTSAGASDVITSHTCTASTMTQTTVNEVLSFSADKDLYISSPAWTTASLNIKIERSKVV